MMWSESQFQDGHPVVSDVASCECSYHDSLAARLAFLPPVPLGNIHKILVIHCTEAHAKSFACVLPHASECSNTVSREVSRIPLANFSACIGSKAGREGCKEGKASSQRGSQGGSCQSSQAGWRRGLQKSCCKASCRPEKGAPSLCA